MRTGSSAGGRQPSSRDDVPYAWAQAAGFVAEFCALGGRIVDRIWIPLGIDPATVATQVPRDVDGVYVGQAILPMADVPEALRLARPRPVAAGSSRAPGSSPTRASSRVVKGVVVGGSPAVELDAAGAGVRARVRKGVSRHPGAAGR